VPISFPPLHRDPVPAGTTLQTYRKDLAETATRFESNAAAAAQRVESEIVEISSLQSEGYQKRDVNDAEQTDCTIEEFKAMQKQVQGDQSTLPRLLSHLPLDAEAGAVLRDIAAGVAEKAGSAEGFFFQPGSVTGDMLLGRATRSDEKSGLLQMFDVALHDTPGMDNGLMLITPVSGRQMAMSAMDVYRSNRSTQGIYLDQTDKGWQYHAEAFPPVKG
jgi:hypothetical protein